MALSTVMFAQSYRNSSAKGLNLRSEPNTSASVMASIPADAKVTVMDTSNSEWYKVKYDDKTGYVSSKYISEDNNQTRNNSNKQGSNNDNSRSNNKASNNSNKSSSSGVTYNTGIGIRFGGWESGLTVKHFIKSNAAIEGILSSGWQYGGTRLTALYEVQKSLGSGLYWFWGVGGHIGLYNERYWYKGDCKNGGYWFKGRWYDCDGPRTTLGIDGILGLEYHFREIPFTIGVDIKPSIDIMGWGRHYGDGAFTVRYAF